MNEVVRTPLKINARQFEDMARKGAFAKIGRVELRRGMMELRGAQYLDHSRAATALFLAMSDALATARSTFKVLATISCNLSDDFVPITDIAVWDPVGVPADHDGPLPQSAVKLAVEVANTSLPDDLGEKMVDYARAGVSEYWVADVQGRVLFIHTGPRPEGYANRVESPFGTPAASPTLGLTVETGGL